MKYMQVQYCTSTVTNRRVISYLTFIRNESLFVVDWWMNSLGACNLLESSAFFPILQYLLRTSEGSPSKCVSSAPTALGIAGSVGVSS